MYRIRNKLALLVVIVTVQPYFASADTHRVVIKNNFFNPRELVIKPGDTVNWVNEARSSCGPYGDECSSSVMHTVTADDGSFTSGDPSDDIEFSMDFNNIGEILYHCQVHSQPGQDVNSFMNGRITVQTEQTALQLNAGLNDAWFNPDTDGQGFFITIFPILGVATLAWFTYDTDLPSQEETANLGNPGHRWLTALGTIEGNKSVMTISFASGGLFDTPTNITRNDGGIITLSFENCNSGSIEYDIPSIGRTGVVPIQRIAADNIILCEALDPE